jgi:transposase InsO family protein
MSEREDYPAAKRAKHLKASSGGLKARASRRTVLESMARNGLKSVHCRRRARSLTDSAKSRGGAFANLTNGLRITSPFQVLKSDISYIRTGEGFAYLCQVKDVAGGVALGWSVSPGMKAELAAGTIQKALRRWDIPAGSLFHSDRWSQYTSEKVTKLLGIHGLRQGFSRVASPVTTPGMKVFYKFEKGVRVLGAFCHKRGSARGNVCLYRGILQHSTHPETLRLSQPIGVA